MEITFERMALYDEVWATPLTQLAKKYSLSDNGLRKICKAMNIPLPTAGHWAKVAVGKEAPRPPLPADAERSTFVSHPIGPERSNRVADDDEWLAGRVAFEQLPERRIVLGESPRRWHTAIAPLRDELREALKNLEKPRRDAERAEKNPNVARVPGYEGGHWQRFLDIGQVLLDTHRCTPMRVTPLTWERALTILDALSRAAEERGFTVTLEDEAGRIVMEGHGAKVEMRITEKLDDAWRKELGWDKKVKNVKYKVPTGRLRLYVGTSFNEREIGDGLEQPLEHRLNDVFVKIYGRVVHVRERQRESEAQKREWEERERRAAEVERQRRAAEARREAERKKRGALVEEAQSWQVANLIRDYLQQLEFAGGREGEWLRWARQVADEMDPTLKK